MSRRHKQWLGVTTVVVTLILGLAGFLATREGDDLVGMSPASGHFPGADPLAPNRGQLESGASRPGQPARHEPGASCAEYWIVDWEGEPLAGVRCWLVVDGKVAVEGWSNVDGLLASDLDRPDTGRLLTAGEAFAPTAREVPLGAGRHTVRLEHGAVLSGQVLVSGQEPEAPLHLRVVAHQDMLDVHHEVGLGWSQLGAPPDSGRAIRARTDDRGRFVVSGLPDSWAGQLQLPVEYRLEDAAAAANGRSLGSLALSAPRQDLVVRARKRHVLRGRIVAGRGDEPIPVADAIVRSFLEYSSGGSTEERTELRTSGDGVFRLALSGASVDSARLVVSPPDESLHREVDLGGRELNGDWDVGDIPLFEQAGDVTASLVVVDESSDPVRGATAALGPGRPSSAPTDEEGRTSVRGVLPGQSILTIYAAGYEVTEVEVPDPLTESLRVPLRRSTLLRIRMALPDGAAAQRVVARVSAPVHPFRSEGLIQSFRAYTLAGCSYYRTYTGTAGEAVVRLNGLETGEVALSDLKPNLAFQLQVEGPYGRTLSNQVVPALAPGEHRTLDVSLPEGPRTLRGRVVDANGAPLSQGRVALRWDHSDAQESTNRNIEKTVDAEGRFSFPGVFAREVFLQADADGFAPLWIAELDVPRDERELTFTLEPERVVKVTVSDSSGTPLPARVSCVLPSGAWAFASRAHEEEGTYVLHGLPDGEVAVRAMVYGAPFTETHDTRNPELWIRIPRLGRVEVDASLFDGAIPDETWLMCLSPATDTDLNEIYAKVDPAGQEAAAFPGVEPGEYFAALRRYPYGFSDMTRFVEMSSRVPVVVRAGETARAEVW